MFRITANNVYVEVTIYDNTLNFAVCYNPVI